MPSHANGAIAGSRARAVAPSGPLRPIDDVHRLTVSDREGVVSYALIVRVWPRRG